MVIWQMVVQHDIQKRLVYTNAVFILDQAKLAKTIHEKADAGSRGADDFRQGLLRDLGNQSMRITRLAEFRHEQKGSRQSLLAGVEELINEISLDAHTARHQELQEQV